MRFFLNLLGPLDCNFENGGISCSDGAASSEGTCPRDRVSFSSKTDFVRVWKSYHSASFSPPTDMVETNNLRHRKVNGSNGTGPGTIKISEEGKKVDERLDKHDR